MYHYQQFSVKVILIMVSFYLLPSLTFAFQNEPTAFRGIAWGSTISNLSDMEFKEISEFTGVADTTVAHYTKKNDKMKIGDIVLDSISYSFYKGKFCGVNIKLHSYENIFKLFEFFLLYYGNSDTTEAITNLPVLEIKWSGATINITVHKYSTTDNVIFISYKYKPLMDIVESISSKAISSVTIPPDHWSIEASKMSTKELNDKIKETAKDL